MYWQYSLYCIDLQYLNFLEIRVQQGIICSHNKVINKWPWSRKSDNDKRSELDGITAGMMINHVSADKKNQNRNEEKSFSFISGSWSDQVSPILTVRVDQRLLA